MQILVTIAKSEEQRAKSEEQRAKGKEQGAKSKEQGAKSKEQRAKGMKLYALRSTLYALCFLLFFIQGCGPTHFVRPKTDVESIKKVAVLPFENFTQDDYAGEKIRRIVITELLLRDVDVIEPGEVTRLLREMKVKSLSSLKITEIQDIGKTLGVEAVMMGSVEAFGTGRGISVNYPEVTINLRMIEVNSGNIVWSVRNASGGPDFWMRHFGSEGASLSEAAEKVVKKAIGTLY